MPSQSRLSAWLCVDGGAPSHACVRVQTTDKKVNEVSPALFARAPDPDALARCSQPEIQDIIQQIGLAPTKSKNIINTAKLLLVRLRTLCSHGRSVEYT